MARRKQQPERVGWRPNLAAIPDKATCVDMLREIMEEAHAAPNKAAPDLTMRCWTVGIWLRHGAPIDEHSVSEARHHPMNGFFIASAAHFALVSNNG